MLELKKKKVNPAVVLQTKKHKAKATLTSRRRVYAWDSSFRVDGTGELSLG